MELNKIYNEDCIETLSKMQNESVDLIVTSPPYNKNHWIKNKNKTKTGRVSRRYLNEVKTWGVNEAKWKAAKNFCADRGWQWTIMTEKHIPGAR